MALLNSEKYDGLNDYSTQNRNRKPGVFKNVFITGTSREGQNAGKMQIMTEFDKGEYLVQNQDDVYWIPMFIKRIRSNEQEKPNSQFPTTVCFSWGGETGDQSSTGRPCPPLSERGNGFCDNCKCKYILAGMLFDNHGKKTVKIEKEDEEPQLALIYFKCGGMKYGGAMDFVNSMSEKAKDLTPLSDNPDFEKNVVTPRRFIIKANVVKASSDFGDKNVFKFEPVSMLPDELVTGVEGGTKGIMDLCMEWMGKFEEQFDQSRWSTKASAGNTDLPSSDSGTTVSFQNEETSSNSEKPAEENISDKPFDLGI